MSSRRVGARGLAPTASPRLALRRDQNRTSTLWRGRARTYGRVGAYGPRCRRIPLYNPRSMQGSRGGEWAGQDSNLRPTDYESAALTAELPALGRAPRRFILGPSRSTSCSAGAGCSAPEPTPISTGAEGGIVQRLTPGTGGSYLGDILGVLVFCLTAWGQVTSSARSRRSPESPRPRMGLASGPQQRLVADRRRGGCCDRLDGGCSQADGAERLAAVTSGFPSAFATAVAFAVLGLEAEPAVAPAD
jgi:hypothetical protein